MRMYVQIDSDMYDALQEACRRDCRYPRQQVEYILKTTLLDSAPLQRPGVLPPCVVVDVPPAEGGVQ